MISREEMIGLLRHSTKILKENGYTGTAAKLNRAAERLQAAEPAAGTDCGSCGYTADPKCSYVGPCNPPCCDRPDYDGATAEEAWEAHAMLTASPAPAQEGKTKTGDEQSAFEEWTKTDPFLGHSDHGLERYPEDSDDYDDLFIQAAWNAWKARASFSGFPAPDHIGDGNEMDRVLFDLANQIVDEGAVYFANSFWGEHHVPGIRAAAQYIAAQGQEDTER